MHVAVGTNNSCGTGQPCGRTTCGCPDEPPDFSAWGEQFALTVEGLGSWARYTRAENGFTDDVRVVAADDAEPAYDPAYENTFHLLEGYAQAVGGTYPAMVDDGSADAHYWTEDQLLQVAYGFRPDVPMPQIYYPSQAAEWAALLRYAKAHDDTTLTIYGVLTGGPGTYDPRTAYTAMLGAVAKVTDQHSIPWLSTIAH